MQIENFYSVLPFLVAGFFHHRSMCVALCVYFFCNLSAFFQFFPLYGLVERKSIIFVFLCAWFVCLFIVWLRDLRRRYFGREHIYIYIKQNL